MTLHITSCMDGAVNANGNRDVVYCCWRDGDDADMRSCNVVNAYIRELCDGDSPARFEDRAPDETKEHPFFDVCLTVSDTHKNTSRFRVAYKRLDYDSLYTPSVANIMDTVYGEIKKAWRRGLVSHRHDVRGAKEVA